MTIKDERGHRRERMRQEHELMWTKEQNKKYMKKRRKKTATATTKRRGNRDQWRTRKKKGTKGGKE